MEVVSPLPIHALCADTRPIYGLCETDARPIYGLCTDDSVGMAVSLWPIHALCADTRPIHDLCETDARPIYGLCTATLSAWHVCNKRLYEKQNTR